MNAEQRKEVMVKFTDLFDKLIWNATFLTDNRTILLKLVLSEIECAYDKGLKDGMDKERLTKLAENL